MTQRPEFACFSVETDGHYQKIVCKNAINLMFFKNMCIIYKLLNLATVGWTTGGFFVYQEYAYKYQMEGSFLDMQQCHPLTQKRTIG